MGQIDHRCDWDRDFADSLRPSPPPNANPGSSRAAALGQQTARRQFVASQAASDYCFSSFVIVLVPPASLTDSLTLSPACTVFSMASGTLNCSVGAAGIRSNGAALGVLNCDSPVNPIDRE